MCILPTICVKPHFPYISRISTKKWAQTFVHAHFDNFLAAGICITTAAAVVPAAVVPAAAAEENDDQNNDPQTTVAAPAIVTAAPHMSTSR